MKKSGFIKRVFFVCNQYSLVFFFLLAVIGVFYTNFFVRLNDFWGIYKLSLLFDFQNPTTWYNGLFPVFSFLELKMIPSDWVVEFSILKNVLLGSLIYYLLRSWDRVNTKKGEVVLLLLFSIIFLKYVTTPGPYLTSIFFALISTKFVLLHRRYFIGGFFLGIAALFRYDVLILSLAFGFVLLVQKEYQLTGKLTLGIIIGFLPQITVDVVSGHLPFSTLHHSPIFFVDWQVNTKDNVSLSTRILKYALLFFKNTWTLKWYYVSIFIGLWYYFNSKNRIVLQLIVIIFTYCFASSFFNPARAHLLLIVLLVIKYKYILSSNFLRFKPTSFILIIYALINSIVFINQVREERKIKKSYNRIESYFLDKKIQPEQVITNSLRFYFPNTTDYRVFRPGGWLNSIPWVKGRGIKEMKLDSFNEILNQCKDRGISYILMEKGGSLYELNLKNCQTSNDLVFDYELEDFFIFKIND